ncbi:hypothetical protein DWV12_14585 [Clostridium botulinum]|uniref:hypothetical protein n=1 Tax=Clostridium botulinum TaxID=1491 RepID=UPI00217D079D|nr:hypothetical protein [Clostridium botulinum]MCS6103536.1 hypothetical protein [Clostridium botulinum]MCS6108573.1 hypothetical protein [Clostridium botulinum]
MEYIFYWDESFHTRKITEKSKSVNIYGDDDNDTYISAYIGGKKNDISCLLEDYRLIETEFKQRRQYKNDQELKGTSFKKKNFTYGLKSFNKEAIDFYSKFFRMLYDNKAIYHITMISKTEILIEQALKGIYMPYVKIEAFYYSLIKFLYNYRCIPIMLNFFKENRVSEKDLIDKIKDLLNAVIKKTKDIKRKEYETGTLMELVYLLDCFLVKLETKKKYIWDYSLVYEGFNKLLREINIEQSDCYLYMDKEVNVHEHGLNYCYGKLKEVDSKQKIGVRIADILSNFIGRISYAIQNDTKEREVESINIIETEDYEEKNLFSPKWFEITKSQFELYKLIAKYFNMYENWYWSTYTGIYFDNTVEFFSLFQYIDLYDTYEEFIKANSYIHTENYNSYVCKRLKENFMTM